MAENYRLAAEPRIMSKRSARDTRASGRIPGVLYGYGVDAQPFSVDYSEFLRLIRKAGQSSLVDFSLDGKTVKVLVHQYETDPVKDTFDHVDLLAVNLKEVTTATVPLVYEGESVAIKNLGGVLNIAHQTLDIRCLPSDIPHEIEVDISSMENIHDHISIEDLNLDEKLEVMQLEADTTLCSVMGRAAEEDLDTPPEAPVMEDAAAESGEEAKEEGE